MQKYSTKSLFVFTISFFFIMISFAGPVSAAKTTGTQFVPVNFAELAKMDSPAVVNIRTEETVKGGTALFRQYHQGPFDQNDPFNEFFNHFFQQGQPRDFKRRALGSGFIIDRKGYIVTNNHVIDHADKIKVYVNDDKEYDAKVIGRDPYTDIALIKINPKEDLPCLKLGDSDALQVGDWVVAIGNPFGLSHTVTAGIVSAKGRVIGSGPYDDFIQTDASINPGNSGGPLINLKGEVVGINTMIIAGGQGIGFAIPLNLASGVIEQLKKNGEVTRGWLGVSIQDIRGDLAQYYHLKNQSGVLVTDVVAGDPADKAGIRPMDVITEVNGKKIEDTKMLTRMIANIGVGETAKITVLRDGKTKTLTAEIGKRPEKEQLAQNSSQSNENELGIAVSDVTPELAQKLDTTKGRGVVVTDLSQDGKASEAGLAKGDIILEINRKPVNSTQDFEKIIDHAKKGTTLSLLVKRYQSGISLFQINV